MQSTNRRAASLAPERITVNLEQARRAMRAAVLAKRPTFLWGHPGIGKSEMLRDLADELYASAYGCTVEPNGRVRDDATGQYTTRRPWFIDLRASTLDPVDVRGMPVVRDGVASFVPFDFLPTDPRGGIVALDEVNRAPALVQNALLELTLDGRVGSYIKPDAWYIAAAGNYESDGGGVTRFNAALSRRFFNLDVEPDLNGWLKWAVLHDIHPMVIAYHRWRQSTPHPTRPNVFNDFDRSARSDPNARAWKFISDVLHAGIDEDVRLPMFAGAIGYAVANDFEQFYALYDQLPKIDLILTNPMAADVPTDVSARYAIASALSARATTRNLANVIAYLERLPGELGTYAMLDATERDPELCNTAEYTAWAIRHQDQLN